MAAYPRQRQKAADVLRAGDTQVQAAKAADVGSICLVALKTGMRMGEIFALRRADVDLEDREART
jgi:integrase